MQRSDQGRRLFIRNKRNDTEYEILKCIGQGAYGRVFLAENTKTTVRYAVKNINIKGKEGFPVSALREINQLKNLNNHPNIVKLVDVILDGEGSTWYEEDKCSCYLVFEYCFHDLFGLIASPDVKFSEAQIKSFMYQLLSAVEYLHSNGVMHRDIKSSNVLVQLDGCIKLSDFGLSRSSELYEGGRFTNRVVTLWYRAPELLLGATEYTEAIDMWSVGCILGEFMRRGPLFRGENEIDQLRLIFDLCGTPSYEGVAKLSGWRTLQPKQKKPNVIFKTFSQFPPAAVDLLSKLLELDPSKRISATEAKNHIWFKQDPLPNANDKRKRLPSTQRNEQYIQQGKHLKVKNNIQKQRKMNYRPKRYNLHYNRAKQAKSTSIA